MSTYAQSDRCTDIILDFIAGPESGGNYNAYFGHANSTIPLSSYTLDEIYAFQRAMAGGSTAILRYQFIFDTLQGLQGELDLPGSTICSPAVQDRLAVQLLVRRGYSSWWRSQLANDEFAHRLALEWASLPDPVNNGASAYPGQRAGVTLSAVYAMLGQARAAMSAGPPAVPSVPAPPLNTQRLLEVAVGIGMYSDEIKRILSAV